MSILSAATDVFSTGGSNKQGHLCTPMIWFVIIISALNLAIAAIWPTVWCAPGGTGSQELCSALNIGAQAINVLLTAMLFATAFSFGKMADKTRSIRWLVASCAFVVFAIGVLMNSFTFGYPLQTSDNVKAFFSSIGFLAGALVLSVSLLMRPRRFRGSAWRWLGTTVVITGTASMLFLVFENTLPTFATPTTKTIFANMPALLGAALLAAAAYHYIRYFTTKTSNANRFFLLGIIFLAFAGIAWTLANSLFDTFRIAFRIFRLLAAFSFLAALRYGGAKLFVEKTIEKEATRKASSAALLISLLAAMVLMLFIGSAYPAGPCPPFTAMTEFCSKQTTIAGVLGLFISFVFLSLAAFLARRAVATSSTRETITACAFAVMSTIGFSAAMLWLIFPDIHRGVLFFNSSLTFLVVGGMLIVSTYLKEKKTTPHNPWLIVGLTILCALLVNYSIATFSNAAPLITALVVTPLTRLIAGMATCLFLMSVFWLYAKYLREGLKMTYWAIIGTSFLALAAFCPLFVSGSLDSFSWMLRIFVFLAGIAFLMPLEFSTKRE